MVIPMSDELPNGIPAVLEYLAVKAAGYDNRLQSPEIAKLKADLMNVTLRWTGVPLDAIAAECHALGMRDEDVATIAYWVKRRQDGHRLVPNRFYADYAWPAPALRPQPQSRNW